MGFSFRLKGSAHVLGSALFLGVVGLGHAQAASLGDAVLEKRVAKLEAEVRLLKNQARTRRDAGFLKAVTKGNSRVKVTIYGQVNRAVVFGFSKRNTEIHHVDNDATSSRLGLRIQGRISSTTIITANLEARWIENTRSGTDGTNDGNLLVFANAVDIGIRNGTFGAVFLGYGSDAADGSAFYDFSGTDIVLSASGCADDGIRFGPPNGNQSAGRRMSGICGTFDGREQNRVMYVSPLLHGFTFKAAHGELNRLTLGLYYNGSPFGMKDILVAGAFGYTHQPSIGGSSPTTVNAAGATVARGLVPFNSFNGSLSILHRPTGLSITGAGGHFNRFDSVPGKRAARFIYAKAGWQGKLISAGRTFLSVDYGQYEHIARFDDFAWSSGVAVVQNLQNAHTDIYAAVRIQGARIAGVAQDMVTVVILGARITF